MLFLSTSVLVRRAIRSRYQNCTLAAIPYKSYVIFRRKNISSAHPFMVYTFHRYPHIHMSSVVAELHHVPLTNSESHSHPHTLDERRRGFDAGSLHPARCLKPLTKLQGQLEVAIACVSMVLNFASDSHWLRQLRWTPTLDAQLYE